MGDEQTNAKATKQQQKQTNKKTKKKKKIPVCKREGCQTHRLTCVFFLLLLFLRHG